MRKRFPHVVILMVVAAWMASSLGAQDERERMQTQRLTLHVKSETPIQGSSTSSSMLMIPVKCDSEQNVYVRGYLKGDAFGAPLTRISADGTKTTDFNLRKVQRFEQAQIDDFTLGLRREVYLLGSTAVNEKRIAKFTDTGEFESSVTVDAAFSPQRIAVFPSGQFLIRGAELNEKTGTLTGRSFTALVDNSGKILSRLELSQDVGSSPSSGDDRNQKNAAALEMGDAYVAEDGNIYIMRVTNPAVIYVLDSSGNQQRRLEIAPPEKGFNPITFEVAYGKIVVQFDRNLESNAGSEQIYSLIDTSTGERLVDYVSSPEVGGTLACYTPNYFLFLGQGRSGLVIQKVQP
jgi:hypothetical protein